MADCREPCEQEQCDGLCDRQPDHAFQHKHEVVVGQPEHKGYSVGHSYPWGLKPESRRKSKGSRVTEVAGVQDRTEPEERTGPPALSDPAANAVGRHHADPQPTELSAAELVYPRSGTDRLRVLEAIAGATTGLSDPQIAEVTGLYLYTAAPRRNELLDGGWVRDSGRRATTEHGREAIVWELTDAARARLNVTTREVIY